MPLLDHFHPPLVELRHWESFHSRWIAAMMDQLNERLPEGYFAEGEVHAGAYEIDEAAFQEAQEINQRSVGVATRPQAERTAADIVVPATFPPEFGIRVFESSVGPRLVAAIELLSPGNKDRPDTRRAFAAKCFAYLQKAIGLIVVDIVTNRRAELLADVLGLLQPECAPPKTDPLTAVAYAPVRANGQDNWEIRIANLAVNQVLPEMPLALGGHGEVLVDFEASYEEAREKSRL